MENEKDLTNQNSPEQPQNSESPRPRRHPIPRGEHVYPQVGDSDSSYGARPHYNRQNASQRYDSRFRYNSETASEDSREGRPYYRQYNYQGEYQSRPHYNQSENYHSRSEGRPYNQNRPNYGQGRSSYDQNRPSYGRRPGYKTNGGQKSNFVREGYQGNNYQGSGYKSGGFQGNSKFGVKRRRPFQKRTADYDPSAKYNNQKVLRYKEENIDPEAPIRLNRFLSNAGVCSRREADVLISEGKITVNGEVITELGHKVLRTDKVVYGDKEISLEDKIYILLNKPKGYVTTSDDPEGRKTVMDLVKGACPERIYPVGRLDRNTTGVLLLTNDGEMAAKMMHPKFMKKKIYHVYCNKPVSFADMQKILEGITLEDGEISADRIEYASADDRKQVGIEIHSGRNRIVRRIFENLGYHVVKLDRVYFAGLTKKNLRRGHWRFLEEAEVNMLRMGAYE